MYSPVNQNQIIKGLLLLLASCIRQFFYLRDVFLGGQFRSKEGRRIYTHWHHFCNYELSFHEHLLHLFFNVYVKQKTKNPYSLPLEYSSNLFTWWEKLLITVWCLANLTQFLYSAFFWNTMVSWNSISVVDTCENGWAKESHLDYKGNQLMEFGKNGKDFI